MVLLTGREGVRKKGVVKSTEKGQLSVGDKKELTRMR